MGRGRRRTLRLSCSQAKRTELIHTTASRFGFFNRENAQTTESPMGCLRMRPSRDIIRRTGPWARRTGSCCTQGGGPVQWRHWGGEAGHCTCRGGGLAFHSSGCMQSFRHRDASGLSRPSNLGSTAHTPSRCCHLLGHCGACPSNVGNQLWAWKYSRQHCTTRSHRRAHTHGARAATGLRRRPF